jgi:4-oxalocrotonate tautomerase
VDPGKDSLERVSPGGAFHANRDDPDHARGDNTRAEGRSHQGATDLLVNVLNKPPALTFVVIQEVELEDWGVGGLPVGEYRRQAGARSPG